MTFGTGWRREPKALTEQHKRFGAVRKQICGAAPDQRSSDLRIYSVKRHDQSDTEACCAFGNCKAAEVKRVQKYGAAAHVDLSRQADWYLARELMLPPETSQNVGTYVSLAADVFRRFGLCTEEDWPFEEKLRYSPPPWSKMRLAYLHKIKDFYHMESVGSARVDDVIAALAAGNPVPYGTTVGDNWQKYKAGDVIGLAPDDATDGHCTVLLGFDPNLWGGVFLGENSWRMPDGSWWGDGGFYLLSPDVVASEQSGDFIVMEAGYEDWSAAA